MSDAISDITVKLNIETPSIPVNLGNLAIFMKGDTEGIQTFSSLEDFTAAKIFSQGGYPIVDVAKGYFAQEDHGNKLFVITYADDPVDAANNYYDAGWEFATLPTFFVANDPAAETKEPVADNMEDLKKLSRFISSKNERFLVLGASLKVALAEMDQFKSAFGSDSRTIIFVQGSNSNEAFQGVGGLVGAVGNETVGSVTWKFRKVGGVQAVDITASQLQTLHDANMFTYVTKAGIAQTSEGKTMSGEFIDALHGDDWVKASLETDLQKLLSDSQKVTYDAAGIARIDATVTAVLTTATNNGIIATDAKTGAGIFTVTAASREESSASDIAARNYTGLKFSYTRSGAIHTVKVNGQINI